MATILDADGRRLTDATRRSTDRSDVIALEEPEHTGALLQYYFGRGQRRVMVDLGETLLSGWLDTRWEATGRVWRVAIDAPIAATSLPRDPAHDAAITARTGDAVALS